MATKTAQTATEAFARYRDALERDSLIQSGWHNTAEDGRELACALGVLGPKINDARQCPSSIMPRWLAQMVPWFFDGQGFDAAKDWGLRFYGELARINGDVPFSVVHDWHASVVGPFAVQVAKKRGRNVAPHEALAVMQTEALGGKKFTADEWRPALKEAYRDANAYANANANADAYADAYANAYANAYVYAYANANANANADAYADAYADADAYAYAKKKSIKRLADGMVECLARVPTSV